MSEELLSKPKKCLYCNEEFRLESVWKLHIVSCLHKGFQPSQPTPVEGEKEVKDSFLQTMRDIHFETGQQLQDDFGIPCFIYNNNVMEGVMDFSEYFLQKHHKKSTIKVIGNIYEHKHLLAP